jgi:hypothetical protein
MSETTISIPTGPKVAVIGRRLPPTMCMAKDAARVPQIGDVVRVDGGQDAGTFDVTNLEDRGDHWHVTMSRQPTDHIRSGK